MTLHASASICASSAAALLVAALSGCVVVDKDTDSDTGTGTGTGTMSASSTAGEGSTSPTSGTSTTGVSATGTSSDDTGLPTTVGTSTTGEGTTEAGTTAVGTTTGELGTTGEGTTEAGTTAESTTGGPATIEGACEAACKVFLECQPDAYPDLPTCAAECIGGAGGGQACEAAAIVFNTCIGGYTCEQLMMALMDNVFGACTDAFDTYVQNCNP